MRLKRKKEPAIANEHFDRPLDPEVSSPGPEENAAPQAEETARRPQTGRKSPPGRGAPSGKRRRKKKKKKSNPAVTAVLILVLLVLLSALGAGGYLAYRVSLVDTVFPGTAVNGVELGGKTREEAAQALLALGSEKYDGLAVTARLPLDNTLTVSAWEAGLRYSADEAADAAWRYGRTGNLMADTLTYVRANWMGKNDFSWDGQLRVSLDEQAVRDIVAKAAVSIDEQLLRSGIDVKDREIHITKGASGLVLDEEAVTEQIIAALLSGSREDVIYESEPDPDEMFDFRTLHDELYAVKAEAQLLYARDYGVEVERNAAILTDYDSGTKKDGDVNEPITPSEEETVSYPALPEGFDFNGKPYGVTRSVVGVDFDIAAAEQAWAAAAYGETVVIPLKVEEPEVTTEAIEAKLFADKLSKNWTMVRLYNADYCDECRTSLAGSKPGRISNVKKACGLLNGIQIMPGEVFSYNLALGERVPEAGWRPAPAYANGEVRQEYGGGICQVSSTLYNAVLYANLEIVERECHQFQVGYLPPGMDATVSWGWPDFKFRNDKDYPIEIVAWVDDATNQCCVQIKGTDTDHLYVVMHFSPGENVDESTGKKIGTAAATYRWIYHDGEDYNTVPPISRDWEAYSKYRFHDD